MTRTRTHARMLRIALATALALTAVGSAPAHAHRLALSFDGQHWRADLRRPLFDPGSRWVPGDTEIETFYVRDDAPTDATMTVAVATSDPDDLLPDHDVEMAVRVAGGGWTPLHDGADLIPVVGGEVDRAEVVRVDVRVELVWASTNQSMTGHLPLDFVVTLAQRGFGRDDGALLPDSGNAVSRWIVVLGAALLGSGVALVAGRRRRGRGDG